MIKPERGEFIPWKTALFGAALAGFLLAGAFLAPVEKSFATPAAEPPKASDSAPEEAGEDSEEDSEAPEPEAEEPRPYLVLPYRSPERACQFARTVIRRHVLTLGYSSREEGPRTPGDPSPDGLKPCAEALMGPEDKRAQDFYRWSFGKLAAGESAETLRRRLSLELHPFPAGGFELYMFGEQRPPTAVEGEAERPAGENPDLLGLMTGGQELLADLQAAPLGGPFDRYFTYPLSYIQSDRAVAMLETLGYSVITYSRAAEAEEGSSVFETERGEGSYDRPVVIRMIDSEVTSLVTGELGNKTGLEGGQALSGVTDAVPQQRLLIVYDERDTPSLDSLLARLQGEIDVAARQILMEAMVLEIDRERLFELGFDFDGADGRWSTSFEEGADGVVNPFVFSWTSTAASSAFDFMASLTALENDGSARVLSRPSILVLDGRQARIKIAEEIPFSGRLEIGQDDLRIQETRFLTAGIILNLRPRATFDNREVSMQVEAIISSAGPSRVQSGTGVLIAPNVQSRQVQTLVRVKNDTPFVIGGLISEQSQDSQAGVPWLMRIPWLGQLFRKDNVSRDSREVIVVIT
ncbi:MAG: type II and III secretion system protein, partial [Acidobacteriota bacterium]